MIIFFCNSVLARTQTGRWRGDGRKRSRWPSEKKKKKRKRGEARGERGAREREWRQMTRARLGCAAAHCRWLVALLALLAGAWPAAAQPLAGAWRGELRTRARLGPAGTQCGAERALGATLRVDGARVALSVAGLAQFAGRLAASDTATGCVAPSPPLLPARCRARCRVCCCPPAAAPRRCPRQPARSRSNVFFFFRRVADGDARRAG